VPVYGSVLKSVGKWGLGVGAIGGLTLDGITWLATRQGAAFRILLGLLVCAVSLWLIAVGHLLNLRSRSKLEPQSGGR